MAHLVSECPELLREWDYDKNEYSPEECTKFSRTKVWWKCKEGHSWQAMIFNRSNGTGCPYCTHRSVERGFNDLATMKPELVKEWDYEKNEHGPEEYTQFSRTKVWWKCKEGHSWQAVIYSRARGTGCPICARQKIQRRRDNLVITNPELVGEWDYEKNECPPEDYSHGMMEKVWWKCKEGHSWQAMIYNRSKGAGCPYCSGRCAIVGKTDLATVNPELLKEWDYDKNEHSPEEYTQFSNTKAWWKCKEGHSWLAVIQSRSNGSGCPYCARLRLRKDNSDE